MTNSDEAFTAELQSGSWLECSNVQTNGDTATVDMKWLNRWKIYRNGVQINEGNEGREEESTGAKFQRVSENAWRLTFDEGKDGLHITTITITSPTTASVTEEVVFSEGESTTVYRWRLSYSLTKQQ